MHPDRVPRTGIRICETGSATNPAACFFISHDVCLSQFFKIVFVFASVVFDKFVILILRFYFAKCFRFQNTNGVKDKSNHSSKEGV